MFGVNRWLRGQWIKKEWQSRCTAPNWLRWLGPEAEGGGIRERCAPAYRHSSEQGDASLVEADQVLSDDARIAGVWWVARWVAGWEA